ncbi:MAG: hypothetical protein JJE13_03400 [Thermoleophilia bacterium]|nr:hypothetical protein [Thermoleophilia bacterium]
MKYAYGDEELYDLSRDPGETRNLITWPKYSAVSAWAGALSGRLAGCTDGDCQIEVTPPTLKK